MAQTKQVGWIGRRA